MECLGLDVTEKITTFKPFKISVQSRSIKIDQNTVEIFNEKDFNFIGKVPLLKTDQNF